MAERLKEEIQEKVQIAGLEVLEARITHLAYAPEIAAAMGEPEAAVKSRYYRLIGRLRKEFGADG